MSRHKLIFYFFAYYNELYAIFRSLDTNFVTRFFEQRWIAWWVVSLNERIRFLNLTYTFCYYSRSLLEVQTKRSSLYTLFIIIYRIFGWWNDLDTFESFVSVYYNILVSEALGSLNKTVSRLYISFKTFLANENFHMSEIHDQTKRLFDRWVTFWWLNVAKLSFFLLFFVKKICCFNLI